jgi:hypothetical protein
MTEADNRTKISDLDKLSIDATIKQEQGLFDLMRHTDTRAQAFIGLYSTLAGAVAAIASGQWWKSAPVEAKQMIMAYGATLVVGALAALIACRMVRVPLPGRPGDFWLYVRSDISIDPVTEFLKDSEIRRKKAGTAQDWAACWLAVAIACGLIAAALGSASAFIVWH